MASIEEKIREFVSDGKKVRALSSDGAFMDKVSAGTATPQDIAKKFGELGLSLTDEEAEKVSETASSILEKTPISQIEDSDLDSISGGHWTEAASIASFATSDAGILGALGCSVVSAICSHKAAAAGTTDMSKKYNKMATSLGTVAAVCGSVGAAGLGVGFGTHLYGMKKVKEQAQEETEEKIKDQFVSGIKSTIVAQYPNATPEQIESVAALFTSEFF